MSNAIYKNLIGMTLPLSLALGCAENRPQAEAVYSPVPTGILEPTSAQPEQRVYDASGTAIEETSVPMDPPPGNATATDWKLGEEIRERLMADRTLVSSTGEDLKAEVGEGGIITLHGSVSIGSEERRICDSIASLPGVNGIDNQLVR